MTLNISTMTQNFDQGILKISCLVSTPEEKNRKLIYKIKTSHNDFIGPINADWALIGLIYPAMAQGLSMNINAPISQDLLFYVENDLQTLLMKINKNLKKINITAKIIISCQEPIKNPGTATGFSAGIDSFSTLIINSKPNAPNKITDLTVFNVGSFGKKKSPSQRKIIDRSFDRMKMYSKSTNTNWFFVDTNLENFYAKLHRSGFQKTATLRNASAALTLQSKISNYLYSSSVEYSQVSVVKTKKSYPNIEMGYIDPIILPIISNHNMRFKSFGASYSRFEKVELVSNYEAAYQILDVCMAKPINRIEKVNCSACGKCMKTMLTLDILGKLDNFSKSFDLEKYNKSKRKYIKSLGAKSLLGENSINDLIKKLKKSSLYIKPSLLDYAKILKSYIKKIHSYKIMEI